MAENRGGKRKGAGRKAVIKNGKSRSIYLSAAMWAEVEAVAGRDASTVSAVIARLWEGDLRRDRFGEIV